jgi:hypothetical protein
MPKKEDIWFRTPCILCGELLTITFDEDGYVEGNIIQCGITWSGIFQSWCTPLGLHPEDPGGFRHMFCNNYEKEIPIIELK